MQDNNQMVLTVIAGFEGGLIIYDGTNGTSRLLFGGNLDEASKYLTARMEKLLAEPVKDVVTPKSLHDLFEERANEARLVDETALRRAMEAVDRADDGE